MQRNILRQIFLYIILVELFSLFAFLVPVFMPFVFIVLSFIILILSFHNLRYGFYILFIELIIDSLGYLFYLDIFSFKISIRIMIWLIILFVWFVGLIIKIFKEKKFVVFKNIFSKKLKYFYILFIFIIFGVIIAYIRGNNLKDLFFDFNAWLYFLLIFPALGIFKKRENRKDLTKILFIALLWVSVKTFTLLFVFSHNFSFLPEIYSWVRDTRVGEITKFNSGFVRIFFQSHIYFIPAFFYVFYNLFLKIKKSEKNIFLDFIYLVLFLSIIILGYSRSNWLGFLVVLFFFFIFLFYQKSRFKNILKEFLVLLLGGIFSLLFISLIINFPLPGKTNTLNALSLVGERASQVSSEAGVSSRWNLLPVLWKEIKTHPLLGYGFGKNITYTSNDPRVREKNPDGQYRTYAFEWGWLDIWFKLGFFALLFYIILLLNLSFNIFNKIKKNNFQDIFFVALLFGLFSIIIIHFFSPYLNHPLGIAYLVLLSSF